MLLKVQQILHNVLHVQFSQPILADPVGDALKSSELEFMEISCSFSVSSLLHIIFLASYTADNVC